MDLGLQDSVVLVTGGNDGLGLALCRSLVAEGASVAFCGRDEDRNSAARAELEADGGDVLAATCDVTDPDDLEDLVRLTLERFGRLDGLVSNAGRLAAKTVAATTDEDWDEDLELKLYAAIRLARLCLPHLAESPHGSLVNVLAIAGKSPGAASAPSSVTRAAGLALTKALSKEVGSAGVRANAVLVGRLESGQWVRMAADAGMPLEEFYEELATSSGIPLGRIGRPEEFGDVVTFLLSPRASFVSGVGLNIDGGASPAW